MGWGKASETRGGTYFKPKEHPGKIVLVRPLEFKEDVPSQFGNRDLAWADITVFTDKGEIEEILTRAQAEARVIVGQIRRALEQGVEELVGRIAQDDTGKGNPAWVIDDLTDKEESMLEAALAAGASSGDDEEVPF